MAKQRVALAAAGRVARQAQRRHLGPLRNLVIKESTYKRYMAAVAGFFTWLALSNLILPTRTPQVDVTLALYIETLWEEGETRGKAGDTISGLQHRIPKLKKNLPTAWRLLSAWQRAELPATAPPSSSQFWQTLGHRML